MSNLPAFPPEEPKEDAAGLSSQRTGDLRANAIGLPSVLFQSIAAMAPAGAAAFALGAGIPFAGGALPLAVLVSLIVCVLIALSISELAKRVHSAGGYATYVGAVFGQEVGGGSWVAVQLDLPFFTFSSAPDPGTSH